MTKEALRVFHFCSYITKLPDGEKLIGDEWDAMKLVKAIKGDPINGYATIPQPPAHSFRLEEATRDGVFDAFARFAAPLFMPLLPDGANYALVPIPSSKSVVGSDSSQTPPCRLATAFAATMNGRMVVHDMLRMKAAGESSRKGGTRNPRALYDNLQCIKPVSSMNHILIDDVLMSGGHLQAARALIEKAGGKVVAAVCVANTIHEHTPASAFVRNETKVDFFDPDAPDPWANLLARL